MTHSGAGLRARARLAAYRRQQPGDDLDQLTETCYRELAASDDGSIDALVSAAPEMTALQADRLRRLARPRISTTAGTHTHPDDEKWTCAKLAGHIFVNHWDDEPHPYASARWRRDSLLAMHDRLHSAEAGDSQS
jgi:hypothetical protein